jgi:cobalt-zinc-cadmium efflux system outer membrane protein
MRRSVFLVLLTCFGTPTGTPTLHAQQRDTLSLSALLASAADHPMLRMKAAELEASRNRLAMKSTLMNPMLMLGVQGLPTDFRFNEEPMTGKVIGLTQEFPFPGKLAAERALAAQDTTTSLYNLAEQRNALAREIKYAYFDLYHLEKSNEAYAHHVRVLDQLIEASEARLAANRGTAQDVLSLKLEQATTKGQIIDGTSMVAMRIADLIDATGHSIPDGARVMRLDMPAFHYSISTLDSLAQSNRPLVQSTLSQAEQSTLQLTRSALERYPDFSVSLMYMQRSALSANSPMNPTNTEAASMLGVPAMAMPQSDLLSATVSVTLPIRSEARHQAIGEAEAMRDMKEAETSSVLLSVYAALVSNLAKLEALREQHDLITSEVLPLIETSEQTSNARLAAGNATIEDVLRNDITLLHRQHDLYAIEAEYNKTIAAIEFLVGTSLVTPIN